MGFSLRFIFFLIFIYVNNSSAQVSPSPASLLPPRATSSQVEKKDQASSFMINALLMSLNDKVGELKYEITSLKDSSKVGSVSVEPVKDEIISELSSQIDQSTALVSQALTANLNNKCPGLMKEEKLIEGIVTTINTKVDTLTTKTNANTVAINKCDSDVLSLTSVVTANAKAAQTYFEQILAKCATPPVPVPPDTGFTSTTQVYGLSSETLIYKFTIDTAKVATGYQFESDKFSLPDYSMKANVGLDVSENWISMLIRFSKNSATDTWTVKTLPRLYYVIKDQSGNAEIKDITKTSYYNFGTTLTFDKYYYWRYVTTPFIFSKSIYTKDNHINIEVHMDSPAKSTKGQSYSGVVMGSITSYKKCKEWSKDRNEKIGTREGLLDWIYSPYFYSSVKGYRMGARFDLYDHAVEGNRKWIQCTVSLLTGEYDAGLAETFNRRTIITIFNQKNANKHLVGSMEANGESASVTFRTPDDVDSFIVNDTIFYQVVVQAL